jgi:hypothetical protein
LSSQNEHHHLLLKFEANLEVGFVATMPLKKRKKGRKKERKKDGLMQVQDSKFHVSVS